MATVAGNDPERIRLFAAGFTAGQAEKIHLGVCHGAMFRPAPEHRDLLWHVLTLVCEAYGVHFTRLEDEFWMGDNSAMAWVEHLRTVERDSPLWHRIRALICGIPQSMVDEEWHTR